jgi:hypothetical protein
MHLVTLANQRGADLSKLLRKNILFQRAANPIISFVENSSIQTRLSYFYRPH